MDDNVGNLSYFEREEDNFANYLNHQVKLEYFSENGDDVELEIEQEEI